MNRDDNGKPVKAPRKAYGKSRAQKAMLDKAKERKAITVAQRLNRDGVPV